MDWALEHWWQIILIVIGVLLFVINAISAANAIKASDTIDSVATTHEQLAKALLRLERAVDIMGVTNMPRDGFPQQMEACWEDVGAKGRFLTDLGGMSVKMREQMFEQFLKALNKPMSGVPAAGSINDVITDLDEWLTKQVIEQHDEMVVVRRKTKDVST